ncbi:hypothetical protein KZP23_08955 [Echinicola marina]|uniref:hypothetical protein n=1 Tax=Echinicola marina TaxID=2859768 RepID=UPI001CF67A50|nr:hypothetical protein [Echinicola marina]UCS95123.1 hypothetical protein KZP23_08955 [Echinicola marina]
MKRSLLFTIIFISTLLVTLGQNIISSQKYKPFKVDLGINLTFPTESVLTTGGGLFIEPRYGINDHLHLGLQLASNILGEGESIFNHKEALFKAQAISNVSITSEYQFGINETRPFIGVLAGMYRRSNYEIVDSADGTIITRYNDRINFGLAPRMGLISGKFRLNATYHFTGKTVSDFLSIGVGMQFGGGKIKTSPRTHNYNEDW